MLQHLSIKDFIVIDNLEVFFPQGFTSITGETGAGKSVFVGALSMLMGKRADTSLIRHKAGKSIIEGIFTAIPEAARRIIAEEEIESEDPSSCVLRRELSRSGKNRCFVNDALVSLATIEKVATHLLDIHSQHRNLLLGDADFILTAIDRMTLDRAPLADYQEAYETHKRALYNLRELKKSLLKASEDFDYDLFRYNELTEANIEEGEEVRLEEEARILRHADEFKSGLFEASHLLNSDDRENALHFLGDALRSIEALTGKLPDLLQYCQRLDSCRIELADIAADFGRRCDEIDADPQRLSFVEARLDLLNRLLGKYHLSSTQELIRLRDTLERQIRLYEDGGKALQEAEAEMNRRREALDRCAEVLTKERKRAADDLAKAIKKILAQLDLPLAEVFFDFQPSEGPLSNGYDKVEFLFSANNKRSLRPVGEIASGGEMSRLMLALKAKMAEKENLPTILFDEIDTGISGRVADKMGKILRQMGENMQVVAITHLPQIAARSNSQKHIEKHLDVHGEPSTSLRSLSEEERQTEIAALLSGDEVTPESIEAAKVLLKEL